jgi:hypothetical protein
MPESNKAHDYTLWLIIYSILLNIFLTTAFSIIFWCVFIRSEWNAGFVA